MLFLLLTNIIPIMSLANYERWGNPPPQPSSSSSSSAAAAATNLDRTSGRPTVRSQPYSGSRSDRDIHWRTAADIRRCSASSLHSLQSTWPKPPSSSTQLVDRWQTSGGASAVKEPGHFEVRKSSSQVRSDMATLFVSVHNIAEATQ